MKNKILKRKRTFQVELKKKKNDELVIEIRKMVERPEIPSKQCRIYKAPHPLRKLNEEAYTPQVVSIGPFHHENERLKVMEEHKERYFRSFVKRREINLEYLVGTIREIEESICGCYEKTINLNSDRFVKMILVDASFILELFFRYSSRSWTSDDPIVVKPRANAVRLDLLLLEISFHSLFLRNYTTLHFHLSQTTMVHYSSFLFTTLGTSTFSPYRPIPM